MNSRILLIEDDAGLALTLVDLLEAQGYLVTAAGDANSGMDAARRNSFDLAILDVMLPGKSGFEACSELRQSGKAGAILLLTARTQVADRVRGLKLGADDYLCKPFDPEELLARVEALLRRAQPIAPLEESIQFGDVVADFAAAAFQKNGKEVALSFKEMQLLQYLVQRRGKIVSREQVLQDVWRYSSEVSSRTIDVHIAWLRQKLEDNPQSPQYIQTVRGKGYRFDGRGAQVES